MRFPRRAFLGVITLLTLAACCTTEPPAAAPADTAASPATGPITVTDSRGEKITLDRPASRVVGLEWGDVEMLISLGVMPVGVADVKGYGTWVTAATLDPSVKDVGTRQEPSVDSIAALQPDLIITESERDSPVLAQLEKVAPVLVTKGSDASRNLERMREDLKMIATAVGKEAEADKLLADLDATLADAKEKIAAAGATGAPYAMADGWKEGSTISIRMFGKGALVSDVAEQLGLVNVWTGEVDPMWGLGITDVEGLTALKDPDTRFFYNTADDEDVFAEGLASNAIWKSLPFVAKGNVIRLPAGIWTFGGPLSCKQYAEALVKAYAA